MSEEKKLFPEEAEQMENGSENAAAAEAAPEEIPEPVLPEKAPYHERYYLRYHSEELGSALDIAGTKDFLKGIGFDGGELKQARKGKNDADKFRNADSGNGLQLFCSYCGTEITGVEFNRMPDGRMRCTTCSSTVVRTKEEVEEIFSRVLSNLESFFGASIGVPVSVEVVDELKLKKKIGVPLGTVDGQSTLILGVAINKKNEYKIILENGAPRISLIATFAHELTHIWQYVHWDNKKGFRKCHPSKRLLVYEGMAKWAEIQYLYLIGETSVAKREEFITRKREDEYGIGFCIYDERYPITREAMSCEQTPFNPDKYPFD